MGSLHRAPRASTAARPPPWTPPSSTPSSSCSRPQRRQDPGPEQLRALGEVSTTYARNTADITDRNNIQYHWIQIEDVPAIWERLEGVGLDSQEACGDSPRPFLPFVAGIAKDEIIDGSPALAEIKRRFIGNPDFSNLPRKFKTALTGHPSHDVAPEVNDVSFVGTVHPEAVPASTCGSAAGSPRTRCSRRSSASGSRWTRSPTPGRAWPRSSATTATAARGRAPG